MCAAAAAAAATPDVTSFDNAIGTPTFWTKVTSLVVGTGEGAELTILSCKLPRTVFFEGARSPKHCRGLGAKRQ